MGTRILILILFASYFAGCQDSKIDTSKQISYFFENMAEFTCADSIQNKVKMKFLFEKRKPDVIAYEYYVPDSFEYHGFYDSYMGRIVDAYYESKNIDSLRLIDSLFISLGCNCDHVRNKIIEHYQNDRVFVGIFETALDSYYGRMKEADQINISLDSLIQISMFGFDVKYVHARGVGGFYYHFLCASIPFAYNYKNRISFLIPGFCREALKTKEMQDAWLKITGQIDKKIEKQNIEINQDTDVKKYEKELHRMLIEEGTLKKSLLQYYEKRKEIEPFRIIN